MRKAAVVVLMASAMSTPSAEPALLPGVPAFAHGIPKDSGNSWKSGNYRSKGRQVNSGNFSNVNGSVKSNNIHGGSNIANGPQCIIERKSVVKWAC
ncbi:hypothetical protein [Nonomuraea sp. SYSU D8015]|uniref:hypothetical protein n=1 Tax=Nonomuraea sp. SYSU D8015 TaxID=2593644 RepID=UPI00166106A7|nr:hypothetical protein [Nonomuraea sp. SYSU D8015]